MHKVIKLKVTLRLQNNEAHHYVPTDLSGYQVSVTCDHMQNLRQAGMDAM